MWPGAFAAFYMLLLRYTAARALEYAGCPLGLTVDTWGGRPSSLPSSLSFPPSCIHFCVCHGCVHAAVPPPLLRPALPLQHLSVAVGALITERSRELLSAGAPASPQWLSAATQLFLALDVFKYGHLDLEGAGRSCLI